MLELLAAAARTRLVSRGATELLVSELDQWGEVEDVIELPSIDRHLELRDQQSKGVHRAPGMITTRPPSAAERLLFVRSGSARETWGRPLGAIVRP